MEKYILRLITLDKLIQRKATGAPKDLAQKLGISESTVYRLLKLLREDMALEIQFCNKNRSYVYSPTSEKFDFERLAMASEL